MCFVSSPSLLNIAKHNLNLKIHPKILYLFAASSNSLMMTSSVSFFFTIDDRFSLRHFPSSSFVDFTDDNFFCFIFLHMIFNESFEVCRIQVLLTKVLKCVEFKFLRPNYFFVDSFCFIFS